MDKIEDIIKNAEIRKNRDKNPIYFFRFKLLCSYNLAKKVNEQIKEKLNNEYLYHEANRQCVISFFSAFEIFLKDMVIRIIDHYKSDYSKIVETKNSIFKKSEIFSFRELFKIMEEKITVGQLIARYCNFNNIDGISPIFGNLIPTTSKQHLFRDLKNYIENQNGNRYLREIKRNLDIFPLIKKFTKTRHDIVHNPNYNQKIELLKLKDYFDVLIVFGHSLLWYFLEKSGKSSEIQDDLAIFAGIE